MRRGFPCSFVALAFAVAAALLASSCFFSTPGVGQGMDYPARWGGGSGGGPPVFVGGPSS